MSLKRRILIITALIVPLLAAAVSASAYSGSVGRLLYPRRYEHIVGEYCREYGVEENLVYAVMRTESGFKPDAHSSAGARGLMQMTSDTFEWLQTKTGETYDANALYSPEISIKYGVFLLSVLCERFSDISAVTAAYHAGLNIVDEWLGDTRYSPDGVRLDSTPIAATNHYVARVYRALESYNRLYG